MGSMHVLRPQDHPLPESYVRAFELADAVIFELAEAMDAGDAALVQQHVTYADGSTLRDHLPAELYQRASAAAERAGISMADMANKKVYALAQGLSGSVLIRAGFTRRWGIETQLRSKAEQTGKPTSGFETLEQQLAVFSSLSDARQEILLRQTLDQMEQHADYGLRGIELWKDGDVDGLEALRVESEAADPELSRALFDDRHARWLPVIEQQLSTSEKTLLVVVGAAHLCGDGSLIELLLQRGYVISQW